MPLTLPDSQFGIIDDAQVCPPSGSFDNNAGYILSSYFCQGGTVFHVVGDHAYALSAEAVVSQFVCWRPLDGAGALYKGPAVRQEEIRLGCPGANPWVHIYTPRPETALPDDSGADGTFLAGYRVAFSAIARATVGLKQSVPPGAGLPNDYPVYYPPTVTSQGPASGDVTRAALHPAGGARFFAFGRVESLLLWAENGTPPLIGPTWTGTGTGTGGAFPEAAVPPGSGAFDSNITRSCTASYVVTPVTVTRAGASVTYEDGPARTYTVAVMPVTVEPTPVFSRAFHPPAFNHAFQGHPNNTGGDGIFRSVVWWAGTQTITFRCVSSPYNGTNAQFTRSGGPTDHSQDRNGQPLAYSWDGIPGANGYDVLEHWGIIGETNQAFQWTGLKSFPSAAGTTEAWGQRVTAAQITAAGGSATPGDDNNAAGAAGQLTVWAAVPAGGNGGSCPFAMPRPLAQGHGKGVPCVTGSVSARVEYDLTTDFSPLIGTPCARDSLPSPYDPPYTQAGGSLQPVNYYNGPFVIFPGPPPPSCPAYPPVFPTTPVPPPPPPGRSPSLLGRPSRHYNRVAARIGADGRTPTGILFWRSDPAVPRAPAALLSGWTSGPVLISGAAGDNSPRLAEDHRGALLCAFANPASGALLATSLDRGDTWGAAAMAIPSGTRPNIISQDGRTLCAAVVSVGTASAPSFHLVGVYRGPGAAFGTAFTFVDGAGTPLSVANDSFGLALAAEGPARYALHVLIAGEPATSDWWSLDRSGRSWTRILL